MQKGGAGEHVVLAFDGEGVNAADQTINANTRVPCIRRTSTKSWGQILYLSIEPRAKEGVPVTNRGKIERLGPVGVGQLKRGAVAAAEIGGGERVGSAGTRIEILRESSHDS